MEIPEIEAFLASPDSQQRLKAITELREYEPEVAVPLLKSKIKDSEFLVRSFAAMGLGKKQTAESFAALLEVIKFDRDPNVRSEAANSLSLFGKVSLPHLVTLFHRDDHWLVRRSILAAFFELDCPDEMFDVCVCGLEGDDPTVKEASIQGLGFLANSAKQEAALEKLLPLVNAQWWRTRLFVAKALGQFHNPQAKEALNKLRNDSDHRVIAAVLESLI